MAFVCRSVKPVYQAIWADNKSFDEVLISKRMVQDHMPDKVLEALEKVKKRKVVAFSVRQCLISRC